MTYNRVDAAKVILETDHSLNQNQQAVLWDAYEAAQTVSSLARALAAVDFDVPELTAQALLEAKKLEIGSRDPVDTTITAIKKLSKIDPTVLHLMDKFPHILKHVTSTED